MSILKRAIDYTNEHLKDISQDIKSTPSEIKHYINNNILRKPQTFTDFNISTKFTQKELLTTLQDFNYNYRNDLKTWIANRLLGLLNSQNFPVNLDKAQRLFNVISVINNSIKDTDQKNKRETETLESLSPQDILSLQMYNYNSNFWNTHIKDWNNLEDLLIYKPKASRLDKPENLGQKPIKSNFKSSEKYSQALKKWKDWINKQKNRNNRNEKTIRMKNLLPSMADFWPLNRLSNSIIKQISDILELWWAGFQHTIENIFHPNILKMSPEEEETLRHILIDVKFWKKFFIVLNHETFANIPMTIIKFMQVANEMWIENVNQYFTTIIWPLLATHKKQNALLNSISNILITHPADNKIQWAKKLLNHQQRNAWEQLEKDLNKDNPQWQIYFCSPSWTRDIVHYDKNGIPQIFIPDESWWSNITTARLIKSLTNKNSELKLYAIATNTTDIKKPNPRTWVSPNNNKRNKHATISMHIEEIIPDELLAENIISTLLKNIKHPISNSHNFKKNKNLTNIIHWKEEHENKGLTELACAASLPSGIFKYLKKFTKTPEYAKSWQLPERFFDDNGKLNIDIIKKEIEELKYK